MTKKDLDIVLRLIKQADLALERARKLERDEDFTSIETTQHRFYEEGYRDAVGDIRRELFQEGGK